MSRRRLSTSLIGPAGVPASRAQDRLAWGPGYVDSGRVFTRENGSEIHPDSLSDGFDRLLRTLNAELPEDERLPRIRFHDVRHTYATVALSAGVHPKIVSERLGHSTIAITLDTYSHVLPTLGREAANDVAAKILGNV